MKALESGSVFSWRDLSSHHSACCLLDIQKAQKLYGFIYCCSFSLRNICRSSLDKIFAISVRRVVYENYSVTTYAHNKIMYRTTHQGKLGGESSLVIFLWERVYGARTSHKTFKARSVGVLVHVHAVLNATKETICNLCKEKRTKNFHNSASVLTDKPVIFFTYFSLQLATFCNR